MPIRSEERNSLWARAAARRRWSASAAPRKVVKFRYVKTSTPTRQENAGIFALAGAADNQHQPDLLRRKTGMAT